MENLIFCAEGVKETDLRWLKSYFESCKHFIAYKSFSTSHIKISCGVPQGSIPGPLILVYINDFNKVSDVLRYHNF